jgi:hypothetical protein
MLKLGAILLATFNLFTTLDARQTNRDAIVKRLATRPMRLHP